MIRAMRNVFFLTVLVSLFACSAAPAQQATDPAARVGNRTVTTKELDDRWRADDPASQAEATQKLYDGRRAALDAIIAETLLTEAAKKKGMTAAAYELEEVGKRIKPVTDSEVVAFYQANINQMQGRSLEVMGPAISRFLTDQQRDTARTALIAELRKAGPEVRVLIDAPRREVEVEATDPSLGRASAPVTLIEFSDFQCPFCQRVEPTLKRVRETYGDKVRIVWKDFPADADPSAGVQGRRGRALRRRPGQVLGVSRSPVRESAAPSGRGSEEARLGARPRRGGIRRVSRHARSTANACETASPKGQRLGVNRIVWKDFPLTQIHPQAFKAGEAAHCAGDQSKYWEL